MQTIIDTTKGRAAQGVHRRTPNKWRAAFIGLILSSGLSLGMAGTAQAALSVSITGPANNTVTLAPANYTLTAIAANAQGAPIQSVAFYANNGTTNTLLGTIAAPSGTGAVSLPAQVAAKVAAKAPIATAASTTYTWNWSSIPMGIYSVTAVVTDKKGTTATSAPVTLVADVPPTVNLTAPAANTVRTAPATFTLTADAAAPIGSIARVEFYSGTTLIGTATAAPYAATWVNVPYGTYSIVARATDNYGFSTTTAPVTIISNEPPTVNLTAPADNSSAIAPANISLGANANDIDGTIAKVEFYAATTDSAGNTSNTLVGTASSAPYSYAWSKVAVGKYTITAVATDNYGAQTTSAPVSITVKPGVLLPYYIHTDQLDTPRVITDTAGNTVWEWQNTDPFGNNVSNENPSGAGQFVFPLRFAGQYYDSETNLAYNVNRDYDPAIGRYVQSDLIGLRGGVNTYGYVGGNPLSYVDPLGQDAILETPIGPLPIITPTQSTPNRGAGNSSTGNTDIDAGLPGGNANQSSSASNKNYSEQPSPNFPPSTGPNLPPGSGGGGICEAALKLCLKGANICGSFKPAATGVCWAAYTACKIATLPHSPPPAP